MSVLQSQLNPRSADFLANAAAMRTLVDDLRLNLEKVALGGGEAARAKHTARGKLLPRERVRPQCAWRCSAGAAITAC